jgi:hypothetical protein
MLTDQQKVDIRRYCGFSVFGNNTTASPPNWGYRYYQQYLTLEYRMNNLSADEETTLQNSYLTNLYALESAIPTASENLDTDRAAVWYHNKNEVRDRFDLFKLWCQRLMEFLGVQGPTRLMAPFRICV